MIRDYVEIHIPEDAYLALKEIAKKQDRDTVDLLEQIIDVYIENQKVEEDPENELTTIQRYLVKYESDWADEMDVEGLDLLTEGDKRYFESLRPTDDKPLVHHVGTNEEIEYSSSGMFLSCYTWIPITEKEYEVIKKLINTSYGHFYYPEINEQEIEEDD